MPWTTPTLKDVRKLTRDFVVSAMGATTLIANSPLRIMSDCQAALTHLALLYLDWQSKQYLPDTAETEWLDRHGNIWLRNADGSKGRKEAAFSHGSIYCTGTAGVTVDIGSVLYGIDGQFFETTEEIVLGSGSTAVGVMAQIAGSAGNVAAGETLSFQSPKSGVDSSATVIEITGGTNVEIDDNLRERVLFRIQHPPMGGDADDYIEWTLRVPGVTRAWSYPNEMGVGTMTVRFLMDELRADNHGIPTEDDIDAVMLYLDTVRPVTVKDLFVVAPIAQLYNLTITGLVTDNSATRARIEASIKKMEAKRQKPGQTMYRAWVDQAVSDAVGEDHHELSFSSAVMPYPSYMPVVGTINYGT